MFALWHSQRIMGRSLPPLEKNRQSSRLRQLRAVEDGYIRLLGSKNREKQKVEAPPQDQSGNNEADVARS